MVITDKVNPPNITRWAQVTRINAARIAASAEGDVYTPIRFWIVTSERTWIPVGPTTDKLIYSRRHRHIHIALFEGGQAVLTPAKIVVTDTSPSTHLDFAWKDGPHERRCHVEVIRYVAESGHVEVVLRYWGQDGPA